MRFRERFCVIGLSLLVIYSPPKVQAQKTTAPASTRGTKLTPAKSKDDYRPDIVIAVKAAARKDCGCGECTAKGCGPCHGKNCHYCVAKALVATDCSCKMCDAKGCTSCGPGCDVCKFHLTPVAEAKVLDKDHKK